MIITHIVQPGETLESLAERFDTTVREIIAINDLPESGILRARIVIRIPVPIIPPTVPSRVPVRNFAARVIGSFLFVLSTDRMLYRRNQPVRITLVKTNISSRPVTLTYPTSQRFEFLVRRGSAAGPIVWRWSEGRVFAQVIQRVTIQPGQSQVFRVTWDQVDNQGRPVGSGVFTVQGENVAQELRGRRISVRIRII